MALETVQSFFSSNKEELELKLTLLSVNNDNFVMDNCLLEIKHGYRELLDLQLDGKLTNDIKYYIDTYIESWFLEAFSVVKNLHERRNILHNNMIDLKQLKLPDQRSDEWYKIRENLLTASSLADALGKGHFKTRDDLLISKTSDKKDVFSKASRDIMQWGVMYEQVATEFYEYLNGVKIVEFGLIPHPKLSVFGASPDGICDVGSPGGFESRMLEIKCPPRRQFTHEVPKHYWMQMQGQLEVCDLDECDFLQVKLEEYSCVRDYEKDCLFEDGIVKGLTTDKLPKGLVLEYEIDDNYEYLYSPWMSSLNDILNWKKQKEIEMNLKFKERWWKITRYECTLVRRDKEWWLSVMPDIIKFWGDVVHYREVGNEEVQKRINGRKRGPRKKIVTIQEPMKGYLMDSDDEDNGKS